MKKPTTLFANPENIAAAIRWLGERHDILVNEAAVVRHCTYASDIPWGVTLIGNNKSGTSVSVTLYATNDRPQQNPLHIDATSEGRIGFPRVMRYKKETLLETEVVYIASELPDDDAMAAAKGGPLLTQTEHVALAEAMLDYRTRLAPQTNHNENAALTCLQSRLALPTEAALACDDEHGNVLATHTVAPDDQIAAEADRHILTAEEKVWSNAKEIYSKVPMTWYSAEGWSHHLLRGSAPGGDAKIWVVPATALQVTWLPVGYDLAQLIVDIGLRAHPLKGKDLAEYLVSWVTLFSKMTPPHGLKTEEFSAALFAGIGCNLLEALYQLPYSTESNHDILARRDGIVETIDNLFTV